LSFTSSKIPYFRQRPNLAFRTCRSSLRLRQKQLIKKSKEPKTSGTQGKPSNALLFSSFTQRISNFHTRNPEKVAQAYATDCIWRNRDQFIRGHDEIVTLLTAKWKKEQNYRLRKELFAFTDNKIAVQFWYEYQDVNDGMKWKRCYGLEDWTFREDGVMWKRQMSGNDIDLKEEDRWFKEGVDVNEVPISEAHW
jgi:nuclear transport factor 2 (NTF2) superfamily protein